MMVCLRSTYKAPDSIPSIENINLKLTKEEIKVPSPPPPCLLHRHILPIHFLHFQQLCSPTHPLQGLHTASYNIGAQLIFNDGASLRR